MKRWMICVALLASTAACNVSIEQGNNQATANEADSTETEATQTPAVTRFVNGRENAVTESLQRNYVDFSFDYPSDWAVTPQRRDGTDRNFVRVAAPREDGYEPFAFHVGSAYGTGNAVADEAQMRELLPQLARQFGSTLNNYQVVSIGEDQVGQYRSWNWRFSASAPPVGGGAPVPIYGRGDIVLPPGATKGVLILTLATGNNADVDHPTDVGESGAVAAIFDSFTLGAAGGGK